ncbi:MAG TPA: COX15/CtaA family protein [Burkholderiaceae bacterium]|nr:COX15/CtaA family protein [Burkholderiaceae bacterium]
MSATIPGNPTPWAERPAAGLAGYRRLIAAALLLTFGLVMLGAYVRLTDAGLGCPDWPGCYGKLTPLHAKDEIAQAVAEQGGEHGPVSMGKAWREMVHRYFAQVLGLLIIAIAVIAWRRREALRQSPALPITLVGVVILQGIFGMWTVTLLLKPAIVTGHLIGGLLTFSMLLWLWLRQQTPPRYVDAEPVAALGAPALLGVVLVCAQIFLGGWTSTNYAALACTDLPTCQGQWWPEMNFRDAFHFVRELGKTGDGENLPMQALTAIHLMHRIGAVIVACYLGWLGWRSARTDGVKGLGAALLAMLLLQWLLGLSNVYFSLPIAVAVAHNGGAAVLLALMLTLYFRARQARLQV